MSGEAAEATAPWWEATPAGAEILVGLVKIDRAGGALDWSDLPDAAVLARRARYTAGVEYVARSYGAAEPLSWQGDGVMLLLGGVPEKELPLHTFRAARELWERMRVELGMPARIAAHVGRVAWSAETGTIASRALDVCGHLEHAAPVGSVLVSEDLALALPEGMRGEMAPIGVTARDATPAYVFPASAAERKDRAAFADEEGQQHWEAFRRYALGPDVRLVRYVGFRLQKRRPPSLDVREVFEAPMVEVRARQLSLGALRAAAEAVAPLREAVAENRSLVVLGEPGSGKTTLLKWLAVVAAAGRYAAAAELGVDERLLPLPISVGRLAEVRRTFAGGPVSVPAALARYFHDRSLGEEAPLLAFLEGELARGSCLVLLDGLDEVRAEEREGVHRWLEAFAAAFPKNRFVASSRYVGYVGFELPEGREIGLRAFDDAQVERFVRALHRAWIQPQVAERQSEQLLEALWALSRNPLLLSAQVLIHHAMGELPQHRVTVYEIFARALCETWATSRHVVAGDKVKAALAYAKEALPILGELALAMHDTHPTGVAPEAFVIEQLSRTLRERSGETDEDAKRAAREFLRRAARDQQILTERDGGAWGFLHLTFQEFFVAAGLHAGERFEQMALEHLFDSRWEEILRLGVGYMAFVQNRPKAAQRFVETLPAALQAAIAEALTK